MKNISHKILEDVIKKEQAKIEKMREQIKKIQEIAKLKVELLEQRIQKSNKDITDTIKQVYR